MFPEGPKNSLLGALCSLNCAKRCLNVAKRSLNGAKRSLNGPNRYQSISCYAWQGTTMRRYEGTTTPMTSASLGGLSTLGNTMGSTMGVYGAPQQMINMPGVGGQYSAQSRAPNTAPNRAGDPRNSCRRIPYIT